jgi:hypothetical protein
MIGRFCFCYGCVCRCPLIASTKQNVGVTDLENNPPAGSLAGDFCTFFFVVPPLPACSRVVRWMRLLSICQLAVAAGRCRILVFIFWAILVQMANSIPYISRR